MRQHVDDGVDLLDRALRAARRVADDRLPRMPATPRESRPCGLTSRIASASPGASRSITARVPSGVWSRGAKPVPPVVTINPAKPSLISISVRATSSAPSWVTRWSTTSKPFAARWAASPRPPVSSRTPWNTPSLTVSTFACSGGVVTHAARRYRTITMPSVSASWGSTRHPWPNGRHCPTAGGRSSTSKPSGDGVVDRLGCGERADAVDEPAARAHERSLGGQDPALQRGEVVDIGRLTRHRASGRRRSAPRPLHGASMSTASNDRGRNGGEVGIGRDHLEARAVVRPSRAAFCAISPTRLGRMSAATTVAPVGRHRRGLATGRGARVEHDGRRRRPRPRRRPTATTRPARSRRAHGHAAAAAFMRASAAIASSGRARR